MYGDKYWNRLNIPVEIDGVEYASKLEARWGVFISKLGYKFEHERRVFVPDNTYRDGGFILHPDFWIPELDLWCEVKPNNEGVDEDMYRASLFVKNLNESCVFLIGAPANNRYDVYQPKTAETEGDIEQCLISDIFKKQPALISSAIVFSTEHQIINSAFRPVRPVKTKPKTEGKVDGSGTVILDEVGPGEADAWFNATRRRGYFNENG
jgi:hypothetical protein